MATKLDLLVDVVIKGQKGLLKGLANDLDDTGKKVDGLKEKFNKAFSKQGLAVGAFAVGAAGIAAFTAGLGNAVGSLIRMEKITAQTNAAIKSTGGAAGVSAQHIIDYGSALEDLTGVEQETIQEGQNLLLTFTNIRNVVGAGNDIFDQATSAITDMSVALGQDMKSSAIQLGKALNDPIKGVTALQRVGVSFTREQKAVITSLVETGDTLAAQKIILAELNKEFGGSAEAFGQTIAGKLERAQHRIGSFFESIIIGTVDFGDALAHSADFMALNFGTAGDRIHKIADDYGETFGDLKVKIIKRMTETGESFEEAADHIEDEARASGIETARQFAAGLADERPRGAFVESVDKLSSLVIEQMESHWDDIRQAGEDMMLQFNVGIFDAQEEVNNQVDALLKALDERLTPAEEMARLHGQKMTLALARAAYLAAGDTAAVAKIDAMLQVIFNQINGISGMFDQTGVNIVNTIVNGMRRQAAIQQANGNLYAIGNMIRAGVGINSEPEDPRSPLRGITKWGGNLVDTYAEGMLGNLGTLSRATQAVAAAAAPMGGAAASALVPIATGPGAVGTNGATVNNNFYLKWDGEPPRGRSEPEIIATLQRLLPLVLD